MIVSATENQGYDSCHRRHHYSSLNGLGLERPMPPQALILGTLIHATLADWSLEYSRGCTYLGRGSEIWDMHWANAETFIRDRYQTHNNTAMLDADFDESYGTPVGTLGGEMVKGYEAVYKRPYPLGYDLLAVEQPIVVPVQGTEHCECYDDLDRPRDCGCSLAKVRGRSCKRVTRTRCECARRQCECRDLDYLECTFDQVLVDSSGRILVPDHKTFGRHPSPMEIQRSDQFRAYTWAAGKTWGEHEVAGVYYNGLWKRNPQAPPKGRTRDECFHRTLVLYAQEEIAEWEYFLPTRIARIAESRIHPELRDPTRSWSTCPNCSFQDMCDADSRQEDITWMLDEYVPREKSPAWRTLLRYDGGTGGDQ